MKAMPTFSEYSFEGPAHLEDRPSLEHEDHESRKFLVGLGNGVWMSLVLGMLTYWLVQSFVQALR